MAEQKEQIATYTNTVSFYDNWNSALQLGFACRNFDFSGTIQLRPVLAAQRGKTSKKDVPHFDYGKDSGFFAFLSAENAFTILKAYEKFEKYEIDAVDIQLYPGVFFSMGIAADLESHPTKEPYVNESIYISISKTTNNVVETLSHIFLMKDVPIGIKYDNKNEPIEIKEKMNTSLEVFLKYLQGVIEFQTTGMYAASGMANKIYGSATTASATSTVVSRQTSGRTMPSARVRPAPVENHVDASSDIDAFLDSVTGGSVDGINDAPPARASAKPKMDLKAALADSAEEPDFAD